MTVHERDHEHAQKFEEQKKHLDYGKFLKLMSKGRNTSVQFGLQFEL